MENAGNLERPEWVKDREKARSALRWRLILGRYAEDGMGFPMSGMNAGDLEAMFGIPGIPDIDSSLGYLYDREYSFEEEFSITEQWDLPGGSSQSPGGMFGHALLTVPRWLNQIRELFPDRAVKTLENDAIKKYGIHEILTDPELLEKIEPNIDLVKTLLTFKSSLNPRVLSMARVIIRKVVKELEEQLLQDVQSAITGVKNRFQSSPLKVAKNLDLLKTVRRNLKNYDPNSGKLYVDSIFFCSRIFKRKEWHVIICIDQSGSMTDSIIHSAVMGGIFASIKSLETSLVVFDTEVVDLSAHASDAAEVLLSVHLGGGTNIAKAMKYCQQLVTNPTHTVFILITDFYEGGSPQKMVKIAHQLKEAGVVQIGLAALDYESKPVYCKEIAERLAEETGMEVGVKTPKELAEFVFEIINQGR